MPSERVQRRIDRLLDQAEEAADEKRWDDALALGREVLSLDGSNEDAPTLIRSAETMLGYSSGDAELGSVPKPSSSEAVSADQPTSFASGRYTVSKFLGEGGKKKVYLAHDNTLDRDVAFALIKTEGLDETSRERVKREAQAMGRMGTHPSIMPIYDLGEEVVGTSTQPYMVQPVMVGGDVEGLVEDADGPLELDRALKIATQTAQGLSFAHGKGIVHRDLKPGNVWLDEDGAAKIGDFGLAVATDRSRLTVEKVMVGTVSYMPPEQATGGEVTPRADLYSLGAMLYEMSTGRVPFMGDDDIGVISQHINTPPVAPSWHNSQIPKTLDSLILRLLAKDPVERPDSADEVLAALNAVDLSAAAEDATEREAGLGSLDSMAGGVFVGRHRELDQLKSIFEEVLSGKGRMVTLVGEPGIGKTRTAQELATYAGMRGAEVLWGRSYESGGAPPYWPWVQAIRSHVAATEPQILRDQLGSTAPVIAEVVSDVKAKLPDIPAPPPIEDPESARFRLFDSISTFLKNTASSTPLVLMLEDLHWSDKPSLMLLEFVARELANSRILIVGNYRDMELNRRHPLSVTLGDLSRERLFERVVLRGLQRHDVERFIEIAAGINPPSALVDTVHTQTEGNPLFVTETVRLLIQEGDIASGQASESGTTSWEIRIPEGVREVIGRRLDRLSERCNEVLTIAAVIGRQFRFDVLKMLAEDTTDNQLLDVMDEALASRIVEELPEEVGLYQFTHAQMQETLRSELSANRLVRMHARIAKALEDYWGDDAEEHAAELAEHFAEAEAVIGPDSLIRYSILAGNRALSEGAHTSAYPVFKRALQHVDEQTDKSAKADLLFGSAICEAQDSQYTLAGKNICAAYDIYIDQRELERALTVVAAQGNTYWEPGILERLDEIVQQVDEKGSHWCSAISRLASALCRREDRRDFDRSEELFNRATETASELGDDSLKAWALGRYGGILNHMRMESAEGLERCLAGRKLAISSGDLIAQVHCTLHGSELALNLGRSELAQELADECVGAAVSSRQADRIRTARWYRSFISTALGNWQDVLDELEEVDSVEVESYSLPRSTHTRIFGRPLRKALIASEIGEFNSTEFGRFETADLQNVPMIARGAWQFPDSEWTSLLRRTLDTASYSDMSPHYVWAGNVGHAVAAALDGDSEKATELIKFFWADSPFTHIGSVTNFRILGILAQTATDYDQAATWYSRCIEYCRSAKYSPELAWTSSDFAEMLLDRNAPGDREKAIELQDEAISIATELGMMPLLERVLAKREILKA